MTDFAVMYEWLSLGLRWLHVICAIAWIGSSFYFIALDLSLQKSPHLPKGAHGEEWQVHGGGFYHINKYLIAPDQMPAHLTWFKWESYATWLSGAALLAVIYWVGADLYMIDSSKFPLSNWQAIMISASTLVFGWIIYNGLCQSLLGRHPTILMVLLFGLLVAMAYGYNLVFTGRATMIHLGAFTATIMTANVFFIIMPNQRIVVADMIAGRTPDAKFGKIAKLRSTHNNYLTLPVIFLMLSNHYPLVFASKYNWLIAALVFLMGVTIRHFFNSKHARKSPPYWTWFLTAMLFFTAIWLSMSPNFQTISKVELSDEELVLMESSEFQDIVQIVTGRCSMCHASTPVWPGIHMPPKGVILETDVQIARYAKDIFINSGLTNAMPPANITELPDEDRIRIVKWYRDNR